MPPHDKLGVLDRFKEKRDYWLKYDTLADSKDKAMIERLNGELDVLLIFVGLFSAVNTAFIVLTTASLSAPPSYRTDALLTLIVMQVGNSTLTPNDLNPPFSPGRAAIRQNCTFFASLCASILAAAGAMLAKQWLQSYQRTGQTGSRQRQSFLRTQKWMGTESWRLRPVIEALPTLLLISLALFFTALSDLLWSTCQSVAIVVVVFAVIGATFYGATVTAAAVDVFCPYQTAVSRIIRELALEPRILLVSKSSLWIEITGRFQVRYPSITRMIQHIRITTRQAWKFIGGELLVQGTSTLCWKAWASIGGDLLLGWMMQTRSKLDHEETADTGHDSICAHSILWMLENATEEEDILACAEHIPTLTSLPSIRIVSHSPLFSTLVQRFSAAVTDVHHAVEGSEESALIFGKAVMHVVADPTRWAEIVAHTLTSGPTEIRWLRGDLWAICASAYLARSAIGLSPAYEISFFSDIVVERGKIFKDIDSFVGGHPTAVISAIRPSTTLVLYSAMKLSRYGIPFDLLDPSTVHQDPIINMLCLEVIDLVQGSQWPLDQRVRDVQLARDGVNVVDYITHTIVAHGRHIANSVDRRGLLRYHTEVLRYCRSAHGLGRDSRIHAEAIREHLLDIIVYCRITHDDLTPTTEVGEAWTLWSWEDRLLEDPLVQIETIQVEFLAYAAQLLLYLVTLFSDDHHDGYTFFTSEDATTLVDAVAKLQGRVVTNMDVARVLKAIDLVVLGQLSTLEDLPRRFNSICPILTRAFRSTSEDVLDAAHGALAAFGAMAWESSDTAKTSPKLFLAPEFGSAALRSLSKPPKDWSSDRDRPLSCWIAASIRSDVALATIFDEPSTTSLFVSRLSGTLEKGRSYNDWATMWNVAYLFLKQWHLAALNTVLSLNASTTPAMTDAVIKSLVAYVQKELWGIHHDTTNVEMFIFIADFVQQAFVLRPAAALLFGLDRSCEGLMQNTKR
ncbi:hypothetical protein FRB94_008020 [Tulasnella sp. JGI-2019a]|nr:hypothetical protein FRB94_008020 [Tulasnella sp. JGI-2019a]